MMRGFKLLTVSVIILVFNLTAFGEIQHGVYGFSNCNSRVTGANTSAVLNVGETITGTCESGNKSLRAGFIPASIHSGCMLYVPGGQTVNIPEDYSIKSLYPNPFNPTLTAVISLPQSSDLTVQVFNVMGQRVATIAEGHYQEGFHSFVFNGQNMASGVYFIIANSPGKLNQVKKIVLMK